MPPAPKAIRASEEKRNRSWGTVGLAQGSTLHSGLALLMIAVSHNTINPCNEDKKYKSTCKKFQFWKFSLLNWVSL